jgi:hypothetical protein
MRTPIELAEKVFAQITPHVLGGNLKDFPPKAVRQYKIEAIHPDDFLSRLIEIDSAAVCEAARQHRARLRNPSKSVEE